MSQTKLERRIEEVATATGKTVVVGRVGHRTDFFANCDGIEYEAPTALAALESVVKGLQQAADEQARALAAAVKQAVEIRAL